jgi:hypothetical protein
MAGTPRFEFAGQILSARLAQFLNELRILRRQPVVQLSSVSMDDNTGTGISTTFFGIGTAYQM